jgi:transposase
VREQHLLPVSRDIVSWLHRLPAPVAVGYEAGPTGFGLARDLVAAGFRCEVAAPSKIRRASGDRVKTDARDALLLARLLQMDDLTVATVPTMEQEAARDLVRARVDCRG